MVHGAVVKCNSLPIYGGGQQDAILHQQEEKMTDKTVNVSLTVKPQVDYSFELKLPPVFAPDPEYVVDLPEGNKANLFFYKWWKTTDGSRYEVNGWRIEYQGPYFEGKIPEVSQSEITQPHLVGVYIQAKVKAILEAKRREDRGNDGDVEVNIPRKRSF